MDDCSIVPHRVFNQLDAERILKLDAFYSYRIWFCGEPIPASSLEPLLTTTQSLDLLTAAIYGKLHQSLLISNRRRSSLDKGTKATNRIRSDWKGVKRKNCILFWLFTGCMSSFGLDRPCFVSLFVFCSLLFRIEYIPHSCTGSLFIEQSQRANDGSPELHHLSL